MGAVDELIDQHEGAGRQLLLERAAGRQRHEIGHARAFEHVDIGAVVDVGRREPMALVMARQEDDLLPRDLADAQRRRRLTPWAFDAALPHFAEPRQVVDAGAADDAEHRFGHVPCPVGEGQAWPSTRDHTRFLVKYISPANTIRKIITTKPMRFLVSMCGSAAHIRKAATSLEYWSTVCGEPSV